MEWENQLKIGTFRLLAHQYYGLAHPKDASSMSFDIDMSSCGFEHEMHASTIKIEPLDNIEKDVYREVQIKVEQIKKEDVE